RAFTRILIHHKRKTAPRQARGGKPIARRREPPYIAKDVPSCFQLKSFSFSDNSADLALQSCTILTPTRFKFETPPPPKSPPVNVPVPVPGSHPTIPLHHAPCKSNPGKGRGVLPDLISVHNPIPGKGRGVLQIFGYGYGYGYVYGTRPASSEPPPGGPS